MSRALGAVLLVVATGGITAAVEAGRHSGPELMVAVGLGLILAAFVDRGPRYWEAALPVLGVGLGLLLSDRVAALAPYVQVLVLGGLGGAILAARLARAGRPWRLAATVLVMAATMAVLGPAPDGKPHLAVGELFSEVWPFALMLVGFGPLVAMTATMSRGRARTIPVDPAPAGHAESRALSSAAQGATGAMLTAGGALTVLIELQRRSVLEAIGLLGLVYLLAGLAGRTPRLTASGCVLAGLGGGTLLAQFHALSSYYTSLVVAGIGAGFLGGLALAGTRWAACGRSLVTVAAALGVVMAAPASLQAAPVLEGVLDGWVFGLLPMASGLVLLTRWLWASPSTGRRAARR